MRCWGWFLATFAAFSMVSLFVSSREDSLACLDSSIFGVTLVKGSFSFDRISPRYFELDASISGSMKLDPGLIYENVAWNLLIDKNFHIEFNRLNIF